MIKSLNASVAAVTMRSSWRPINEAHGTKFKLEQMSLCCKDVNFLKICGFTGNVTLIDGDLG
jgi:hypothetical protein